MKQLDVNAAWGFWPIQHFSWNSLKELDSAYEQHGVHEVWLSAVESILYPEPDTFDEKLFKEISEYSRFRPVKTVNPLLANWKKSLNELISKYGIVAIKLFPNYHGYSLDLPVLTEVAEYAVEKQLPVLVQIRVNDERNQPTCMQVMGVPIKEIVDFSNRAPQCSVIALNAYRGEIPMLAGGSSNLAVEPSFVDGVGAMDFITETMGRERVAWGTGSPFLHIQASILRLEYWK